jgi:hypothetical protein
MERTIRQVRWIAAASLATDFFLTTGLPLATVMPIVEVAASILLRPSSRLFRTTSPFKGRFASTDQTEVGSKAMDHSISWARLAIIALSMATAPMPASMMQQCPEILCQIASGRTTNWIAKNLHHNSKLIREIRRLHRSSSYFTLSEPRKRHRVLSTMWSASRISVDQCRLPE